MVISSIDRSTTSTTAPRIEGQDEEAIAPQTGPSSLGRRVWRHVPSADDDEPVARFVFKLVDLTDGLISYSSGSGNGSTTETTLTNAVHEHEHDNGNGDENPAAAHSPVTPRPSQSAVSSYLQSPASVKRRRLEELADERLAKDKRRRYGH